MYYSQNQKNLNVQKYFKFEPKFGYSTMGHFRKARTRVGFSSSGYFVMADTRKARTKYQESTLLKKREAQSEGFQGNHYNWL